MTNTPTGAAVPQDAKPVNTNDLRDYADEISNPYAQLILDAAHQLDVARTDRNILDGLVSDLCARLKATTALVEKLESEAYQLRAALTPPADDEIGAIRARHEAETQERPLCRCVVAEGWASQAHTDRATLLRAVDHLSAELAKERERLDAIQSECWDLRCFDIPTGGGDADVGWRVVGHFMAPPHERIVSEMYTDNPRAAIDAARAALNQEPGQ